jgi:hypothetical protein
MSRLHLSGNAVFLWNIQFIESNVSQPIGKPKYLPTNEQLSKIKVSPGCEKDFQDEMDFLREKMRQLESIK